jgi:osmotically-inducible protein OsmY
VENYYVAAEADRIAAGVHGISQVDDRLHVAHGGVGYAHRRSIGPFGSHFESWTWVPRGQARRPDGEIACDIQHELARSDLLDDDEVSVKVHDGVAMLTGTVDSWQQRTAATDRALEAGATAVFNSLLVE